MFQLNRSAAYIINSNIFLRRALALRKGTVIKMNLLLLFLLMGKGKNGPRPLDSKLLAELSPFLPLEEACAPYANMKPASPSLIFIKEKLPKIQSSF